MEMIERALMETTTRVAEAYGTTPDNVSITFFVLYRRTDKYGFRIRVVTPAKDRRRRDDKSVATARTLEAAERMIIGAKHTHTREGLAQEERRVYGKGKHG